MQEPRFRNTSRITPSWWPFKCGQAGWSKDAGRDVILSLTDKRFRAFVVHSLDHTRPRATRHCSKNARRTIIILHHNEPTIYANRFIKCITNKYSTRGLSKLNDSFQNTHISKRKSKCYYILRVVGEGPLVRTCGVILPKSLLQPCSTYSLRLYSTQYQLSIYTVAVYYYE